ncbi:ABC transporter permease [Solirubrobacter sp. CPCC 204708]|uniref:Transport permease protein n=1 Tax=Solirubrobacter deserti TaxID=2282478 RepID=A0ABT4RM96_9ACTN|nr:ABC transporter permease [Solirubrobacter deserti]MBE2317985.1 ABC transporter permease [Solirubrobacter deserti]MDA0139664.1 ABC transporter permease [Solirubrobacter deserti]
MSRAAWRATQAMVLRDLRILLSYRFRWISILLGPAVFVVLFYYVSRLVVVESVGSSDGYFSFVITGMAGLAVLTAAVSEVSTTLRNEQIAGTLERLATSAFGPLRACVAMTVYPVLQAMVVGMVTILMGMAIGNLRPGLPELVAAVPALALVAFAFAPLGLLAAALTFVVRQATMGVTLMITVFSVVAGVYFPISLLPEWIRWTSDVQPFTPAVGILRHLLATSPLEGSVWGDAARLAAFTVVLLPLSLIALRAALAHARARGTMTEY